LRAFDSAISKAALLRTKREPAHPRCLENDRGWPQLSIGEDRASPKLIASRIPNAARLLRSLLTCCWRPATIVGAVPIEIAAMSAEIAPSRNFQQAIKVEWALHRPLSITLAAPGASLPSASPHAAAGPCLQDW